MTRYVVQQGWTESPHLSEDARKELEESYLPHERAARTQGIPALGSGVIYPVSEQEIRVSPFELPKFWRHSYALDVGWNRTAAVWGALDPEGDVLYLYSEHYRSDAEPAIHAQAIKSRGEWIPGVIDPASRGRSQTDGQSLLTIYRSLGLHLTEADNSVESGIYDVWTRLSTGRLKVFSTLTNFFSEYRIYRRDDKGKVVKEHDHLMDACLAGDTLVVTNKGSRPIRDLVGTTGRVLSRSGAWVDYADARLTRQNSEVIELEFADGQRIVCTPDHRFLTPDGWVRADCMEGRFCYDAVSQRIQWKDRWIQLLSARPVRNLTEGAITFAASIFSAMGSAYIAWFGSPIMASTTYPMDTTSITSTKTDRIIGQKIYSFCGGRNTCRSTTKEFRSRFRLMHWRRQRSGTEALSESIGTDSIMRNSKIDCTRRWSSPANNAESSLLDCPTTAGSVQTPARHGIGFNLVLTTKNVLACFAAHLLLQIATLRKRPARANVARQCLTVRVKESRADVYCLSVPGARAFAIEGGLVVHNCRYLCRSGINIAAFRPADQWHKALPQIGARREKEWTPLAALDADRYGMAVR